MAVYVALRKESVDRNACYAINNKRKEVALRKESVDRNKDTCLSSRLMHQSLSARRAWIEININGPMNKGQMSLSARRAWIEMSIFRQVLAF